MNKDNFFNNFIASSRKKLSVDTPKWFVLGNESSDLDSIVCSIVYAYYKQLRIGDLYNVIPVICIPKKNITLKNDVIVWLKSFKIDIKSDLIYLEELKPLMKDAKFTKNLKMSLVDHHKPLDDSFIKFIREVIDHREIQFEYSTNQLEIHNIELVGSCCTLIAVYILTDKQIPDRNILLKFLHGVILLDTECLRKKNGKTTDNDIETTETIEKILNITNEERIHVYEMLKGAKSDVSGLTFGQSIERDLKIIEVDWKNTKLKIAIPVLIAIDVQDILAMEDIETVFSETLRDLDANILIILTCGNQKFPRRGYIIFSQNLELNEKMSQYLLTESKLKLEQITDKLQSNIVSLVENHVNTTRKIFIPLIEKFFVQESKIQLKYQSNNCNVHLQIDEIDHNSGDECEREGAPYTLSTPLRSCSGTPDSRNSEMTLPSLNNRRTLALIDQKRLKHSVDMDVTEDENLEDDSVDDKHVEDVSPLAYTPENSDEEDNVSTRDNIGPLPSLNNKYTVEKIESKRSKLSELNENETYHFSGEDNSFTPGNSVSETKGSLFPMVQKTNNLNNEFISLAYEVDKKRLRLEISNIDGYANSLVKETIDNSEDLVNKENFYQEVLNNWSESYSKEEIKNFVSIVDSDDSFKMANLLTIGLIRDCLSNFEFISLKKHTESNNNALPKDFEDDQLVESDENSSPSLPDSTIPDLEINYNSCPIGAIINKENQCAATCVNTSHVDVENSSFNLYRRISNNQLDFSEDEKKLFALAGNWCPDEDIIYSDCDEQENNQLPANDDEMTVTRKILYPNTEITMNLTNLETNTSTEISLNDLDLMLTPDLKMIEESEVKEISDNSYFSREASKYRVQKATERPECHIVDLKTTCDEKEGNENLFDEYKIAMHDAGYYYDVTNNNQQTKIVTISSCYFPEKTNENYQKIMQYVFNYTVNYLGNIDTESYTLVYFHCYGNQKKAPSLLWIHQYYRTITYKVKKNLKHLYIVHPTIWVKALLFLCRFFINSKFYRKIQYVSRLEKLQDHIPTSNIQIPSEVLKEAK